MKKILILIFILISIVFIGCSFESRYTAEEWKEVQEVSEFEKTKEEIIKFDNEYKEIKEKLDNDNELFGKKYLGLKITSENIDNIGSDFCSILYAFIDELKKIYVPEPLDDFYDKTIEYYSKLIDSVKPENDISSEELTKLDIERNRIQREIYRKYNLEYLLK